MGLAIVPLNQLALSPQCGFSSTEEGNLLTEANQWAKARLTVEIAKEVWEDALEELRYSVLLIVWRRLGAFFIH